MTEAELVVAFHGAANLMSQVFFGYISLMSGFLVICYLVADKLPSFLASIVVTLFTLVSALLVFRIFLNGSDVSALLALIVEGNESGRLNLPWIASGFSWAARVVTILEILVTVGGYFGCIAFFFYRRKFPNDYRRKFPSDLA